MGINKKMPTQEIGLYKMAKEAKAIKDANKTMKKTMMMANAISMSENMKAPIHNILIKKKK